MPRKNKTYRLLSLINSSTLLLQQILFPFWFIFSPTPAFAESPSVFSFDFAKSSNSFTVHVPSTAEVGYGLYYVHDDNVVEAVTGSFVSDKEIKAGTCSTGGACVEHIVKRGIFKYQSEAHTGGISFVVIDDKLTIISEYEIDTTSLMPEEEAWLNGTDTSPPASKVKYPDPTPTPEPAPMNVMSAVAQTTPITIDSNKCMADLYGSKLNCTANDVSIANVSNIVVQDSCDYPGDNLTFTATWDVKSTATERYNIGLYFASGGQTGALNGSCSISSLPNSPVPPWYDFDQNICGDISSAAMVHPEITMTVKCLDPDGDNILNLPYCTSWEQNSSACTGPLSTIPGAPSKCNCDDGFEIPITVPHSAQIEVVKDLIPNSDSGTFNLQIDGVDKATNLGDGTTGKVIVSAGTSKIPGAIHTVSETAYGSTDLSLYNSSISCVDRGKTTFDDGPALYQAGTGPIHVDVDKDDDIVCTITNSTKIGSLVVQKTTLPSGDQALFTINATGSGTIGGSAAATISDVQDHNYQVSAGTYWVTETVPTGWIKTVDSCQNVEVGAGQTVYCQLINTKQSTLKLNKTVVNNDGGTATTANFQAKIDDNNIDWGTPVVVSAGLHTASETTLAGYVPSIWGGDCAADGSVTLAPGENKTCTITNDDIGPKLKLVKQVINDNGGNASASAWTLTATGEGGFSDNGYTGGFHTVKANVTYDLTESTLPGYGPSTGWWVCDGGQASGNTVKLSPAEEVTCTIVNDDITPTLTVIKKVINDDGGKLTAADFGIKLNQDLLEFGAASVDGSIRSYTATPEVAANISYWLTENDLSGYAEGNFECTDLATGNGLSLPLSLEEGQNVKCVVVNNDVAAKLKLVKRVVNDGDGGANPGDWRLTAEGDGGFSDWGNSNTFHQVLPGVDYELWESEIAGYNQGKWLCDGGSLEDNVIQLALGQQVTCSITNDDVDYLPTISVDKRADVSSLPETGGQVLYNLTITNTSQVDAVTLTSLTDDKFGALSGDADCMVGTVLPVGGSCGFSISRFISGEAGTTHTNWFSAVGVDDENNQAAASDYEDVVFTDVLPDVSVVKTADKLFVPEEGGLISFTYFVTNNSSESATITKLTDDKFGELSGDSDCQVGTVLSSSASCSFESVFALPAHNLPGTHINTFSAAVTDGDGNFDTATDDETVTYIGAKIKIDPPSATNNVGESHQFTVSLLKNLGEGYIPAAGVTVSFSMVINTANANFQSGINSCVTGADGRCDIVINSVNPGEISMHASALIGLLGYDLTRETDGKFGSTDDAIKTYVGGKIIVEKQTEPDESNVAFEFQPSWSRTGFNLTDDQQHDSGWLVPGLYSVAEILPQGWDLTNIVCEDPNQNSMVMLEGESAGAIISLEAGEVINCTFTNTQHGTVKVYKFEDMNSNGAYDQGELLLSDWEMTMTPIEENSKSQITDENGKTEFDLVPGQYQLEETLKSGWKQTAMYCETTGSGVLITRNGEAYGHHGNCDGWNGCGDAATCAQWACEVNGYDKLVSYGDQRPCTEFGNCNLFNYRGSVQMNWGNWCPVMGVTDIVCSGTNMVNRSVRSSRIDVSQQPLVVSPGDNTACYVGNFKYGGLSVLKYQEKDGELGRGEGEAYLGNPSFNFRLYRDMGEGWQLVDEQATNSQGKVDFDNLTNVGSYYVCEVRQSGWQEGKSLNNQSNNLSGASDEFPYCQLVEVNSSGFWTEIEIGNQYVQPRLTIEKFNNRWPNTLAPNDEVNYTIVITAHDNVVYNVKVSDLLPKDIVYQNGTYQALSSISGLMNIAPPTYASPGTWTLGTMAKDEVITLTYKGKLNSDIDAGTYKDIAWAAGTVGSEPGSSVVTAASVATERNIDPGNIAETFVGTKILVDRSPSADVNVIEEKQQGKVLGATTLPATGANIVWLLVSAGLIGTGTGLWIAGGKRKNRHA